MAASESKKRFFEMFFETSTLNSININTSTYILPKYDSENLRNSIPESIFINYPSSEYLQMMTSVFRLKRIFFDIIIFL